MPACSMTSNTPGDSRPKFIGEQYQIGLRNEQLGPGTIKPGQAHRHDEGIGSFVLRPAIMASLIESGYTDHQVVFSTLVKPFITVG